MLSLLKLCSARALCMNSLGGVSGFIVVSEVTVSSMTLSSRMGVQNVFFPSPFAHRLECV